jgi:hypothetical protein
MLLLDCGSTDASLTPFHVDRGKLFISERFGKHNLIDAQVIQRYIELTRFPVPLDEEHSDTINYPGLVRAADLIGQLSDPRYLQKIPALFYEFEETGLNKTLGYRTPGDLRKNYPTFYRKGCLSLHSASLTLLRNNPRGQANYRQSLRQCVSGRTRIKVKGSREKAIILIG